MFAIGFVFAGIIFIAVILLFSMIFPSGKWRYLFVMSIFIPVIAYPFLHKISPNYTKFKYLCSHPTPPTIIKTKAVDFILIDYGFPSDSNCTEGPSYIANYGYLGFDCRRRRTGSHGEYDIYRYTRKSGANPACQLECFDAKKIDKPESSFGFNVKLMQQTRNGYLAGDERHLVQAHRGTVNTSIPFWRWLRFIDSILVDEEEGEMAFTTNYYYLPFGPLDFLGLASGAAPSEHCSRNPNVDPRNVYIPKTLSK